MIFLNRVLKDAQNILVKKDKTNYSCFELVLSNSHQKEVKTENSKGLKFAEIKVTKNDVLVREYRVALWYHKGVCEHYVTFGTSVYTKNKCNIPKKFVYEFIEKNLVVPE